MRTAHDIYKIPKHEFEERIARVKETMSSRNLDALLVFGTE